jgi:hypothetical protein
VDRGLAPFMVHHTRMGDVPEGFDRNWMLLPRLDSNQEPSD